MSVRSQLAVFPREIFYLLLFAFLLRAVFIVLHQRPLYSDEQDYHALAVSLTQSHSYEFNGQPTAYRPVGFPLFLATVYTIAGSLPIAAKLLQAVFDALSLLLLYMLGRNHEKHPLGAAVLWAIYVPAILYSNLLFTETIYVSLMLLVAWVATAHMKSSSVQSALLGLCLGLAILVKPTTVVFLLFFLPFVTRFWKPLNIWLIIAGCALVVAPWTTRNLLTVGSFSLSTNAGFNLLMGNNPNATGTYSASIPDEFTPYATSEVEADRAATALALKFIVENPHIFVMNAVKKMGYMFTSDASLLVWTFHPSPSDTGSRFSHKYRSIPVFNILLVNISFALMTVLGILGFLAHAQTRLWTFFLLFLLSVVCTHAVFFGGSRYHFQLMPFFIYFANTAILHVLGTFRSLSLRKKAVFSLSLLLLFTVWTAETLYVFSTDVRF